MAEQKDTSPAESAASASRSRVTLLAALQIEEGEERPLALLVAFSFFVGIVQVSFFSASSALFLTTYGSSTIPWVYIASAVVASTAGALFYRVERRAAPARLLSGALLFLLVTIGVFRLSLDATTKPWPAFALLAWFPVITAIANVVQWTLAGSVFDVRQGKRLFGLVGGGELLASMVGGALTPVLVGMIGTENLLWISVGGLVMCLATMLATVRFAAEAGLTWSEEDTGGKARVRFRDLLKTKYTRVIFIVYSLSWMTYQLIDFTFYGQAQARFGDADELARFFGLFFGVTQGVTLILVTFVTSRLMSRMGIHVGKLRRRALLACLLAMLGAYFVGNGLTAFFVLAVFTKMVDLVCARAVTAPVFPVLYQVLPRSRKFAVQVTLESIIAPVAGGIVGALLLVVSFAGLTAPAWLTLMALVTLSGWMYANRSMAGNYQSALSQALVTRTLEGGAMIYDDSMVDILKDHLTSAHPGEVIYALDLLDKVADEEASDHYGELLGHPTPEVRIDVLGRIRRERPSGLVDAVRDLTNRDRDPGVRGEALRALCALTEADALDTVSPYLDHPDPIVRRGAMSGLLRFGGIDGVLAAGQYLIRMETSRNAGDRQFTATVLGDVGITSFYRPLVRLLQDADPDVRVAALGAAGEVKNDRLWPEMLRNLEQPRYHGYAALGLVRAGAACLPALNTAMGAERTSPELKVRIASICGRIGGDAAVETLVRFMGVKDRRVRQGVLEALRQCGYRADGVDVVDLRRLLRQEASDMAWLLRGVADVTHEAACRPLTSAILHRVEQLRHRCFLMLSFLYDASTILRAEENLRLQAAKQRAYALEVLQETVARDLHRMLAPVFEVLSPAQRLARLAETFPQERLSTNERVKRVLVEHDMWLHPWVKSAACHAAAHLDGPGFLDALTDALDDPEPLVRETAVWALGQVDPSGFEGRTSVLKDPRDTRVSRAVEAVSARLKGDYGMLLTIERVLVLKSVAIFEGVPEEVLSALATVMEEFDVRQDETVYEKGGSGRTMYIIVTGGVKVHDGDRTFVTLKERDFFGELTTLDPAPHSASVTAVEDTRLLGLDRDGLYELMADHPAVLRKIIHELCERLRGKRR